MLSRPKRAVERALCWENCDVFISPVTTISLTLDVFENNDAKPFLNTFIGPFTYMMQWLRLIQQPCLRANIHIQKWACQPKVIWMWENNVANKRSRKASTAEKSMYFIALKVTQNFGVSSTQDDSRWLFLLFAKLFTPPPQKGDQQDHHFWAQPGIKTNPPFLPTDINVPMLNFDHSWG